MNYIIILYQNEIDKQHVCMKVNGLELSSEKTNMELPQFKLNSQDLLHKSEVKFLRVYFTTKSNWKRHLETILSKARKGFN